MADFDFGFTLVDEEELDSVQQLSTSTDQTQAKLDRLYNAIAPLLNNLKANPEKEYIKWPDRITKVEAFEEHLLEIYKS